MEWFQLFDAKRFRCTGSDGSSGVPERSCCEHAIDRAGDYGTDSNAGAMQAGRWDVQRGNGIVLTERIFLHAAIACRRRGHCVVGDSGEQGASVNGKYGNNWRI